MSETDRLAEIKERWAGWEFRRGPGGSSLYAADLLWGLQQDQRWLIAEVERLRTVMDKARLYIGLWDATDVCYESHETEGHETEEHFRERENQMLTLGDLRDVLRRALQQMAAEPHA